MSMPANFVAILIVAGLMQIAAYANDAPAEIDYLLTTMGSSDCTLTRNGKEYNATDTEAHLRMKYRRGKRYASTTEDFIKNLASRSSMSKKPYHITCEDDKRKESGVWLRQLLAEFRSIKILVKG